jgi:hypothetical protein
MACRKAASGAVVGPVPQSGSVTACSSCCSIASRWIFRRSATAAPVMRRTSATAVTHWPKARPGLHQIRKTRVTTTAPAPLVGESPKAGTTKRRVAVAQRCPPTRVANPAIATP